MLDFDNIEIYETLIDVCNEFQIDPSSSIEMEAYFRKLLGTYPGVEVVNEWLRKKISAEFKSIGTRPKWLQSAEWPIVDGIPAFFIGQIDIPLDPTTNLFHDTTSFYLFITDTIETVTVMQQM